MSAGDERGGAGALAPPALPGVAASQSAERVVGRTRTSEPFPPLYGALRSLLAPILRSQFRLEVSGLEHLPAGPFIVAANHHNYLDGIVLGIAVPRPIAFLVMPRVYRASPLHPSFHDRIGSICIDVDRPDPGAMRRALRVLRRGGVVGIFPEGPWSREGRLVPGQPGVAALAMRARVPVVPAAIRGTFEALTRRRLYIPRRHPLSVRFGPPLDVRPEASAERATTATGRARSVRHAVTGRIMDEIAALLEPVPAGAAPAARRPHAP